MIKIIEGARIDQKNVSSRYNQNPHKVTRGPPYDKKHDTSFIKQFSTKKVIANIKQKTISQTAVQCYTQIKI